MCARTRVCVCDDSSFDWPHTLTSTPPLQPQLYNEDDWSFDVGRGARLLAYVGVVTQKDAERLLPTPSVPQPLSPTVSPTAAMSPFFAPDAAQHTHAHTHTHTHTPDEPPPPYPFSLNAPSCGGSSGRTNSSDCLQIEPHRRLRPGSFVLLAVLGVC